MKSLYSYYNAKELDKKVSEQKAKLQYEKEEQNRRRIKIEETSKIRDLISKIIEKLLTSAEANHPDAISISWQEEIKKLDAWTHFISQLFKPIRSYYGVKPVAEISTNWRRFKIFAWEISTFNLIEPDSVRTYLAINGRIFEEHISRPGYLKAEECTIDDRTIQMSYIDLSENPKYVRTNDYFKNICSDLINKADIFGITQEKIQVWKMMLQDIS